jgi:hypothetical protein
VLSVVHLNDSELYLQQVEREAASKSCSPETMILLDELMLAAERGVEVLLMYCGRLDPEKALDVAIPLLKEIKVAELREEGEAKNILMNDFLFGQKKTNRCALVIGVLDELLEKKELKDLNWFHYRDDSVFKIRQKRLKRQILRRLALIGCFTDFALKLDGKFDDLLEPLYNGIKVDLETLAVYFVAFARAADQDELSNRTKLWSNLMLNYASAVIDLGSSVIVRRLSVSHEYLGKFVDALFPLFALIAPICVRVVRKHQQVHVRPLLERVNVFMLDCLLNNVINQEYMPVLRETLRDGAAAGVQIENEEYFAMDREYQKRFQWRSTLVEEISNIYNNFAK